MAYLPSDDVFRPDHVRQVVLERFFFHARMNMHLEAIAPMVVKEVELMEQFDYLSRSLCLQLRTAVAKGETTHESKSVEFSYEFKVFESWWDHFKYDLKTDRILKWIPRWRNWANRLKVNYRTEVKKRHESIPVSVIRVCPHATFSWDGEMRKHVHFLFPLSAGDYLP